MEKNGKCHICGKNSKLTFEHVPPKSFFNNQRVNIISGDEILKTLTRTNIKPWDTVGLKYNIQQKGIGDYTLCEACNNYTGSKYAPEYIEFSKVGYKTLQDLKPDSNNIIRLTLHDVYPLRIIKQIITMFCSKFPESFLDKNTDLREFILNSKATKIDTSKFRISMYFNKYPITQFMGITILGTNNGIREISTMDIYPFGFVFEINPKPICSELDITEFANKYKYDEKKTIQIDLPVYERNTIIPLDYRTKDQI